MSKLAMLRTLPSSQEKPLLQQAQEQVQTLTAEVQSLQSQIQELQASASQMQQDRQAEQAQALAKANTLSDKLKKAKALKLSAQQEVQSLIRQRWQFALLSAVLSGLLVFALML